MPEEGDWWGEIIELTLFGDSQKIKLHSGAIVDVFTDNNGVTGVTEVWGFSYGVHESVDKVKNLINELSGTGLLMLER